MNEQALTIKEELKKKLNLNLSEKQAEQLSDYYDLLIEKNRVMNLTRIVDFEDALEKHFADSLALLNLMDLTGVRSILDLGTGAGFPGIPLAVMLPQVQFTLVDTVGKKTDFVREASEKIGLHNVNCLHARAEELAHQPKYREKFDLCVSRAVANLSTLSEYCLPFVKRGGSFAAYKAGDVGDEIFAAEKAIQALGGSEPEIISYNIYNLERTLVVIKKDGHTPRQYPRKAGTPSRKPIS